ncbi:hypothetical protein B0T26DRAFT_873120 [Lasiosphaeria miniovina]|uniref:Rhodopsin domain-containing protein n=1 Tax=Lasiosphaeria miniovina TaxID=1954250 RepID=A0AA40ABD3_9PEZI|nr:uncharacterized protein B0T26DRAFT_873120 [Lasiosphaeria miniovina]KAK0712797.1 hypothetical protein B0T26DRAFT_873120 [Lasiosphaeria miniovina]
MSDSSVPPPPPSVNGTGPVDGTAPPPPPPFLGIPITDHAAYLSQVYIGLTSVLLALCILTFCTRIYQRVRPVWKVGLDDWFIMVGFALAVADWAMLLPMMVPEAGYISLDRAMLAGKNSWLAIPIWGLAMTCIKISIALTLLRIQEKERTWRIFLFTIIAVQAIYGVGNTIFDLGIACHPLAAAWDITIPNGTCVSVKVMQTVSNVGSGINITTDVLLSLAPATFLRKLNRPLRERIFVCVLMGMGLVATISSVLKTALIQRWGDPLTTDDWWAMGVSICTYTSLEQLLGVLAACVPALKGILQRCLGRVGVSLTDSRSRGQGYYLENNRSAGGMSGVSGAVRGTAHSRTKSGDGLPMGSSSRFGRGTKDDMLDDDEECLDMPEIHRSHSIPKSSGTSGSGSLKNGIEVEYREQLPAHAV